MEDNVYHVHRKKKTMENKDVRAQIGACEAAYAEYAANQAARDMRKSLQKEPAFLDRYFSVVTVVTTVCSFAIITAMWANVLTMDKNGIGMLNGYEHGYFHCGKPDPLINKIDGMGKVVVIPMNGYTVYVNPGHENDREIQNLKAQGLVTCND
jgi:hypothetical protein